MVTLIVLIGVNLLVSGRIVGFGWRQSGGNEIAQSTVGRDEDDRDVWV